MDCRLEIATRLFSELVVIYIKESHKTIDSDITFIAMTSLKFADILIAEHNKNEYLDKSKSLDKIIENESN